MPTLKRRRSKEQSDADLPHLAEGLKLEHVAQHDAAIPLDQPILSPEICRFCSRVPSWRCSINIH
eukprot:113350-Amphidinium_carterae.1